MKLIPFLRFGGGHAEEEEDLIAPLPLDVPEMPTDEESEEEAEEEEDKPDEEKKDEEQKDQSWNNDDELLKAFTSVDEAFVDNTGLTSDMEEVTAEELLQEARALASAFGVHVVYEEQAV